MRRVCGVLTALVLSGAISAALAETRTADEKADVALVEREIRAVDDAIAIHDRAKERVEKAVALSSLGQELRKAQANAAKAWQDLKASRAHREYLGKDKITDRRARSGPGLKRRRLGMEVPPPFSILADRDRASYTGARIFRRSSRRLNQPAITPASSPA